MKISPVTNSGNIVIDSLIGYWYVVAQEAGIDFTADICIPMKMPFKGADICLILGNLLENSVEAAQKADIKKYIRIKMKYDKNNLLLYITLLIIAHKHRRSMTICGTVVIQSMNFCTAFWISSRE